MMGGFSYPEVGATRQPPLPPGYRYLTHRVRLGGCRLERAGEAVLTWQLHRAIGPPVEVSAPRAAPGVRLTSRLGIGRLALLAPTEVVWVVRDETQVGFAYGTLPGHPAHGEESFVASRGDDGTVWFTVTSFSRPASWYMAAAGPIARLLQRVYALRCAQVMRRLCREPGAD